jgi:hypothetical protein
MKYLLLPPVWGVILFHVFIKKKIISAQTGPPTIYSLESEGIMKFFSHFKMHIVKIDKLCFYLERNLQVIDQFIMLSKGRVVLQG